MSQHDRLEAEDREIYLSNGYTRKRHFEIIYHDLMDLYGPMIGIDGVGLWVTYRRYVQNDQDHLLVDRAWPSTRGLAGLFACGRNRLGATRDRLEEAGLISVTRGADLAANRDLTLAQLAKLGIQNPAATLFVKVNDPLELDSFCDQFGITYAPKEKRPGLWVMAFENYTGRLMGPNRLMAAKSYIEDHLHEVTAEQIRSLLRCGPSDRQTLAVRSRLLDRHRQEVDRIPRRIETSLPDDVVGILRTLGWRGSLAEVEDAHAHAPRYVWEQLDYWQQHREDVQNPAAALRESLRLAPMEERHAELEW